MLRIRATEERIRADGEAEGVGDEGLPWCRAEIHAESLDWLPHVIAALDGAVRIEGPRELRDRVRVAAERMLRAADDE